MATATISQHTVQVSLPREHGATAMLLTPFVCAAILMRQVSWQELVTLFAVVIALGVKDPLVVLARQRLVWKQEHPETRGARRAAALQLLLLAGCGLALVLTRDWRWFTLLFLGAGAFTVLAVTVNVRNRQRSAWFQVASAVALTSTSVAASLSVANRVPGWCWLLWFLSALQASAGIFVVHARLDARIAARRPALATSGNRTSAILFSWILVLAAAAFVSLGRFWIGAALAIAALGYGFELMRQRNSASLQMPLTRVGQQALALSMLFAIAVILGLR